MGAKDTSNKDIRYGIFKQKYILNPTVTAADSVIVAAQKMADSLKTKMNRHLGNKTLTTLSNLQKIFAHASANKKATKDPAQHTPNTKMTHLTAPALNPALEKLSVASPIIPLPLRNISPPPRAAFRPPPMVLTPLDLSQPTPLSTANKSVLTGIENPRVPPPKRFPNVPTA